MKKRWRIRDTRKGRRGYFANELFGAGFMALCGVVWLAAFVLLIIVEPIDDPGDVVALFGALLAGVVCTTGGTVFVRSTLKEMRTREDRVWLDGADLWWIRHRPKERGAEPSRVTRAEIVEVRLSAGDRAVVVRALDGTDHTVTDVGSRDDRAALAQAIGGAIEAATAVVHPQLPPDLPARWRYEDRSDSSVVIWRRPVPGRWWPIPAVAFLVICDGSALVGAVSDRWIAPTILSLFVALGLLLALTVREVSLTRPGLVVYNGRLATVRVGARSGEVVTDPSRAVAVELRRSRWTGRVRLGALLESGQLDRVMAGWRRRRIARLARWLADRADVPLRTPRRGVDGGSDRDDVASNLVRR